MGKRVIIIGFILIFTQIVFGAPTKKLWPYWQAYDSKSHLKIDYSPYQAFLRKYVHKGSNGVNQIYYSRVSKGDKRSLDNFIEKISATSILQYNRQEQLAFWINLYNAATIKLILDKWPVRSITQINISPGFFSFGPWDAKLLRVENQDITLNDIEHRILRPIWRDPKLHYALNCASMSCPEIQSKVYTAQNAQSLMVKAARHYINSSFGVEVKGKTLTLSKIYQWYQADFGGSELDVRKHMAHYAKSPLKKLLQNKNYAIQYRYDWSVNGK